MSRSSHKGFLVVSKVEEGGGERPTIWEGYDMDVSKQTHILIDKCVVDHHVQDVGVKAY